VQERELLRRLAELESRVLELRRAAANLPDRFSDGAGGGIPGGSEELQVLMTIDSFKTVAWDWPRFAQAGSFVGSHV